MWRSYENSECTSWANCIICSCHSRRTYIQLATVCFKRSIHCTCRNRETMQMYNSLQYLGSSLSSNGSLNCRIYSPNWRVQFNVTTKFVTSISTGALAKQLSHVSSIIHFIHCLRLPYMFVPVAWFTSVSLAFWLALEVEPNEFNITPFLDAEQHKTDS